MASSFALLSSPLAIPPPLPPSSQRLRSRFFPSFFSPQSSPSPSLSAAKPDVVVTRDQGKNAKLVDALTKYNIHCLEVPLIKHVKGPDNDSLPGLLCDNEFDWIVITSPEAASVFLDAWKIAGTPKVRVGVVGAGTAIVFQEAVQSFQQSLEVAFCPSKATGRVLASELPKLDHGICKVLYPASVKAGNEIENGLSQRGFQVTRMNTYDTVPIQDVEQMILVQALSAPVVAASSPSTVRSWVNLIHKSQHSWDNAIACVGETTALAAKKLGLKNIYYPKNPGLEGWVDSILEALRAHGQIQ